MHPQVSVILPVYNSEAYLAAAVESILNQSFEDFELIAVEGGSSDRSPEILSGFAGRDARVRVVRQSARGLVGALNHGISLARGEFLARMDADDVSRPERFERQLRFLHDNPTIAVVGSAITLIDDRGRQIREIDYPLGPYEVARSLETGSALAHPAVMMRREAVQRMGGYREVLDHAEDYDLWLRMSEQHGLANLPDRLLLYRHHASKRGCVFAFEQELHTQAARLAASARRAGRVDPLADLTSFGIDDIGRFSLSAEDLEQLMFALLAPLLAGTTPAELARAAEVLERLGPRPLDRARAARCQIEVASRLVRAGDFSSAAAWYVRAFRLRPRTALAVGRSIAGVAWRRLRLPRPGLPRSV
jgi:GT2 family glycosyltransferase